jgi:hypothetical protein
MRLISALQLLVLVLVFLPGPGMCQDPIKAKTETGKDVLLYPDGKWKYVEETKKESSEPQVHNKPLSAKTPYKPFAGNFEIWMDENKWAPFNQTGQGPGMVLSKLKLGDAYAMIISEEIGMSNTTIKELAIENAKKAGPDFKLISEENRTVNGRDVVSLKFAVTVKGISLAYYGYYYGGKEGTIQVLCYTGENLFDKYQKDMTELMDGLTIK